MIGTTRQYLGQLYHCVAVEPYRRRDGGETELHVWESECATCGVPFLMKVPKGAEKFAPNRRCQKHKRPGQKVRAEKRRAANAA